MRRLSLRAAGGVACCARAGKRQEYRCNGKGSDRKPEDFPRHERLPQGWFSRCSCNKSYTAQSAVGRTRKESGRAPCPAQPKARVVSGRLNARLGEDGWWSRTGSNRRPQQCDCCALPTELRPHRSRHLGIGPQACQASAQIGAVRPPSGPSPHGRECLPFSPPLRYMVPGEPRRSLDGAFDRIHRSRHRPLYLGRHRQRDPELADRLQRGQHPQPLRLSVADMLYRRDRAGASPDQEHHPQSRRHRHLAGDPDPVPAVHPRRGAARLDPAGRRAARSQVFERGERSSSSFAASLPESCCRCGSRRNPAATRSSASRRSAARRC